MEYRWQTQDKLDSCLSCHWWLRCGPGRRREQEESGKPARTGGGWTAARDGCERNTGSPGRPLQPSSVAAGALT